MLEKLKEFFILFKNKNNVEKSIEIFHTYVESYLKILQTPDSCEEAAVAIRKIAPHYLNLLKLANRHGEGSAEYERIFNGELVPVLDRISEVSMAGDCFKSKVFKTAFDEFIRKTQQTTQKVKKDS